MLELLTTDGWETLKASVVSLWRHAHPERVESELAEARADLLRAHTVGDGQELHRLLRAEWQARLIKLLVARPDAVDEVRRLLHSQERGAPEDLPHGSTALEAHVSGGGSAYQAGRDLTIATDGSA